MTSHMVLRTRLSNIYNSPQLRIGARGFPSDFFRFFFIFHFVFRFFSLFFSLFFFLIFPLQGPPPASRYRNGVTGSLPLFSLFQCLFFFFFFQFFIFRFFSIVFRFFSFSFVFLFFSSSFFFHFSAPSLGPLPPSSSPKKSLFTSKV